MRFGPVVSRLFGIQFGGGPLRCRQSGLGPRKRSPPAIERPRTEPLKRWTTPTCGFRGEGGRRDGKSCLPQQARELGAGEKHFGVKGQQFSTPSLSAQMRAIARVSCLRI